MKKIAVIYKSHYGFTETYARWIAEALGADLLKAKQTKSSDLKQYDTIIYGGGLYAGGVSGVSLLSKNFETIQNKDLYLFTVGASDVTDSSNTAHIQRGISDSLGPQLQGKVRVFHLRGGLCYSRMSLLHRMMMSMLVASLRRKPETELSQENREMIATYGSDVDFSDAASIEPLLAAVRQCLY